MAILNLEGRWIRVNRAVCTILGYPAEEILDLKFQDITHPEDLEADLGHVRALLAGEIPTYQMEKRYLHRSGRIVWALLSVSLVRDALGAPRYFISQIQDISERKRAEADLRERDAVKRAMYEGTHEALVVIDVLGPGQYRYVDWNHAAETLTGVRSALAAGRSPHEVFGPVLGEHICEKYSICVELGQEAHEWQFRDESPDARWLQTSLTAVRDASNRVIRIVGVSVDVTERRRAEANRLEHERQMQHAQKLESLGVLAGGISHDFNNLLTTILGYSDLIQSMAQSGTPMRGYIDKVVEGAKQAAALTQQMLAYSGKGQVLVEPINLSALVAAIGGLLEISIAKKCTLDYQFAPDLPTIEGDPAQIRQVVMNLILNASDAMAERSGKITIRTRPALGDDLLLDFDQKLGEGVYSLLEVSDQGCGMSEETRRKIFDPFFTTKVTGRGLGLAVVLGIVRGHGGAIRVLSELGRGTTFRVLLPASDRFGAPALPSPPTPLPWRGSGVVLIVDDEESVRMLSRVMCEKMGFRVVTADDGQAGIDTFREHAQDICLVLLDLTMPNLDGQEVFLAMQEIQPEVRVILSSGYSEQVTAARFTSPGLAGFIQKPYRYADLVTAIRSTLEPEHQDRGLESEG